MELSKEMKMLSRLALRERRRRMGLQLLELILFKLPKVSSFSIILVD